MTEFQDTSNWEKKNASTIIYRYQHEGKRHEGELELEPHPLHVQVVSLSVKETTAWAFADEKQPDSTTGFQSHEYIKIEGRLHTSKVHVFTLGQAPTVFFDRIEVSIYRMRRSRPIDFGGFPALTERRVSF